MTWYLVRRQLVRRQTASGTPPPRAAIFGKIHCAQTGKDLVVGALTLVFLSLWLGPMSFGDSLVVRETDSLYRSLDLKDAGRPALALRLADLMFNEALSTQQASGNSDAEIIQIETYRKKALDLYKASFDGLGGVFEKPKGDLKWKIEFQMARLDTDLGDLKAANMLWLDLVGQKDLLVLRKEAALRLAESLDALGTSSALKAAENYFNLALNLCEGGDVCSYIHYRKGWIFHRQEKHDDAISEMRLALFDSKKQLREESLRDLILFLGYRPGDGQEALALIQSLENQLHRPYKLTRDLAEAYFSNGNRRAGVFVLEQLNTRNPNLKNMARLTEEQYGFRDWDQFRGHLDQMVLFTKRTFPQGILLNGTTSSEDADVEKILRRLTVQLDGERVSQKNYAADFKQAVLTYLAIFPRSPERSKMIDGWLAAEDNSDAKLAQLATWISEERASAHTAAELRLREIRAGLAQKAKKYGIVVSEMDALKRTSSSLKQREMTYQEAHAYYEMKDFDKALPLFQQLAALQKTKPDSWAILSQNLAIDILAQNKKYPALVSQVDSWVQLPEMKDWMSQDTALKTEVADMQKAGREAQFENAVALGETTEALKVFFDLCLNKELLPKSCNNAKILSVKLKNNEKLIAVLKVQNDQEALASELEAMGEFGASAEIQEKKMNVKSDAKDYLRVALLYELGEQKSARDRVLKTLMANLASRGSARGKMEANEALIYSTLRDADLLDGAAFRLTWSPETRLKLADQLEATGKGSLETKKILANTCEYTGPSWLKMANENLEKLDKQQRAISFYGKQSQRKFKQRINALKKVEMASECYIKDTTSDIRIPILGRLAHAYGGLNQEILATPLPEGIPDEALPQIRESLAKMTEPFTLKKENYEKLLNEQLSKITTPEARTVLENFVVRDHDFTLRIVALGSSGGSTEPPHEVVADPLLVERAKKELRQNPEGLEPIETLQKYYESVGQLRLSAYFQGRLIQAKKENQ